MAIAIERDRQGTKPGWATTYPPLAAVAIVLFLVLVVLPSALNLPQANPQTTPEYAPVPPDDKTPPPPQGNLSSLGLASTGAFSGNTGQGDGAAGTLEPPPPPPVATGKGKNPSTKRCVGKPPRQTEDKLAPPCVAFFDGDNFGETYQGVNGDEIRILIYHECCIYNQTSKGVEPAAEKTFFDLAQPIDPNKNGVEARTLQAFQSYFNDRFQTYKRFVHFYLYYASSDRSIETRRSEAVELYDRVKPFAVLTYTTAGNEAGFLETMAKRGVLNFGADQSRDESFYNAFPKLIWGYQPSIQVQARQYSSYVCTKVVPYPVTFSGNSLDQGKPRKFGLLYLDDPAFPEIKRFTELAEQQITECGGKIALRRAFVESGSAASGTDQQTAATNMAAFQQEGITTILWPQGFETLHSKAGANINYRPEWVVAGDRSHDGNGASSFQEQSAWAHAWVVSNLTLEPPLMQSNCALALREGNPQIDDRDITPTCSLRNFYNELRQLFTGIQVAGPRLGPTSIDRGFHAIPAIASTDPSVPACYYEPNDYTCVKDAVAMWWDSTQRNSSGTTGCWRMAEGAQRYLVGRWRDGDVLNAKRDDDPCVQFGGVYFV